MRMRYLLVVLLMLPLTNLICADKEELRINSKYESLLMLKSNALDESLAEKKISKIIGDEYDLGISEYQNDQTIRRLNDADLRLLFRSAYLASFYTKSKKYVRDLMVDMGELERRKLAVNGNYVDLYEMMVLSRMLKEAEYFRHKHPSLKMENLPAYGESSKVEDGSPSEWIVQSNENRLWRQPVKLEGSQIVVISHPLCHFSMNAMQAIQLDSVIGPIFRSHAKWLSPQDSRINFDLFKKWNKAHPDMAMSMAYKVTDWPMFDSWATPTFYFLRNGEVMAKIVGWPTEGHMDQIKKDLHLIGLYE